MENITTHNSKAESLSWKPFFHWHVKILRHENFCWKWKKTNVGLIYLLFYFIRFGFYLSWFKHHFQIWKQLRVCRFALGWESSMGSFSRWRFKKFQTKKNLIKYCVSYVMNCVGIFLCFQTESAVFQIVSSAFTSHSCFIRTTRQNFVFRRNTHFLEFRCQNAIDFVVILVHKCWWIDLDQKNDALK